MHLIFVLNTNFQGKPKKGYNIQGIRGETNMKKIYSLFILSILALTMFVGCQMPTDTTQTVDAEYGFVPKTVYNVYAPNGDFMLSKNGEYLIYAAKELNFVKEVDYTIVDTDVPLTESGINKVYTNGGMPKDTTTTITTYTVSVGDITSSGSSYRLVVHNAPIDGYKKGDTVEILITNGNFDVNTGYGTPEGLYLVKVHIKEGKTELTDIPVTVTKDHKIQFTMPDKNINVFAQFCEIRYELWGDEEEPNYKVGVCNNTHNLVTAVLCFNCKAYDNLEEVLLDGKKYYVLEVTKLSYDVAVCFNETKYGDYELRKTGTLDDDHYMFGVIDTNGLTILEAYNKLFFYDPNATHIN